MRIDFHDSVLTCTTSIGVTEIQPTDGISDDAMRCADHALYRSNSQGRNGICVWTAPID
jgi:PleD family two-component response regulator